MTRFQKKLAPLPANFTLSKGSVHIAVQRGYVKYAITNPDAKLFRIWLKKTGVPDETFFPTLNNSPQLGVPV